MTQQEKTDLAILHSKCEDIRSAAFFAMDNALNMEDSQLRHFGCKTRLDAAVGHFKYSQKQILGLINEYLKKYPK